MIRNKLAVFGFAVSFLTAVSARAETADRCLAMAKAEIAAVQVRSAEYRPGGGRGDALQIAHCRVEGRIRDTIGFELWMPDSDAWKGRMLGVGVGGSGGRYGLAGLAIGVSEGFAAITTDSGHKAENKNWMLDRRAAQDYAHRAEHLTAVAGKALIAAYYGEEAHHSYFVGCSGGGRKALKEMQRYPGDYNGIIAGAPGPNLPVSSARHLWAQKLEKKSGLTITQADWDVVTDGVLAQCDDMDGLSDGVLEYPPACKFNVDALKCRQGASQNCIPPDKLTVIKQLVGPMTNENGEVVEGGLLPGVRTRPGGSTSLANEMVGQAVQGDPDWNPDDYVMARDMPSISRVLPELVALDTDLTAFEEAGGKAIMYQGWLDPSVRAGPTLNYFLDAVAANRGDDGESAFLRMFMAPGMGHCRGGAGVDQFGALYGRPAGSSPETNMLSALVAWVEEGRTPERIIAVQRDRNGAVIRTRPLCSFPRYARYDGEGDENDAANFECRPISELGKK